MPEPVLFILGAGPKIGQAVADAFAAKNYKIALSSRSVESGLGDDGRLRVKLDLSEPASIAKAFEVVSKQLGPPSVVVYNAAERIARDPKDPLSSITAADLQHEFAVNTLSPLLTAQEAVQGFKQLPESASRTFIFTGNLLNTDVIRPEVLTFATTKTASAKWIRIVSEAYKERGFKFYFADERQANGGPSIPVSGPAAAEAYLELAEDPKQRADVYTFVHGKGYVDFTDKAVKASW